MDPSTPKNYIPPQSLTWTLKNDGTSKSGISGADFQLQNLSNFRGVLNTKETPNRTWVFPKMVVPQNRWFIRENPIKMDDLRVPLFHGNTHTLSESARFSKSMRKKITSSHPHPFASKIFAKKNTVQLFHLNEKKQKSLQTNLNPI